ncbi:MAG: hypothetical protein ACOY5R_06240 [Pseudomonadota bacterium]
MDARAALLLKLRAHPELSFSETPDVVRIEAPGPHGFAVELHSLGARSKVFLGNAGFHESFGSGSEALNFIAWCYSGTARLREIWRGGSAQAAVLEALEAGEWRPVAETRFFLVPFWRLRREIILENPSLLQGAER